MCTSSSISCIDDESSTCRCCVLRCSKKCWYFVTLFNASGGESINGVCEFYVLDIMLWVKWGGWLVDFGMDGFVTIEYLSKI